MVRQFGSVVQSSESQLKRHGFKSQPIQLLKHKTIKLPYRQGTPKTAKPNKKTWVNTVKNHLLYSFLSTASAIKN